MIGYVNYTKRLLAACGYQYEILKYEISLCEPSYELRVYGVDAREWDDADSWSTADAGADAGGGGESIKWDRKLTWMYGHSGFEMYSWAGYDNTYGERSEYAICKSFLHECVFPYPEHLAMPALPCVRSLEELKLWLAVNGK